MVVFTPEMIRVVPVFFGANGELVASWWGEYRLATMILAGLGYIWVIDRGAGHCFAGVLNMSSWDWGKDRCAVTGRLGLKANDGIHVTISVTDFTTVLTLATPNSVRMTYPSLLASFSSSYHCKTSITPPLWTTSPYAREPADASHDELLPLLKDLCFNFDCCH